MQSGLINKVAVTPANLTDSSGFKRVCPSSEAAYADKGYCVGAAPRIAQGKKEKERWYSRIRSPYERVFSRRERGVRYRGIEKNQFAVFMQSICFNLKRLLVLSPPNLCLL